MSLTGDKYGVAVFAVLAGFLLAGCGDDGDSESGAPPVLVPAAETDGPAELVAEFYELLGEPAPRHLQVQPGRVVIYLQREDGGRGPLAAVARITDEGLTEITSPAIRISEPQVGEARSPESLEVVGEGRGFEGNLIVQTFDADQPGTSSASAITTAGARDEPERFTVELNLEGAGEGPLALVAFNTSAIDASIAEIAAIPIEIENGG